MSALLALAVWAAACSSGGDAGVPGGRAGPEVTYADPAPVASGLIDLYGTGSDKRYLTIGTNDGTQFSDEHYADIAANYSVVVFTKFHGGWDVALHHEATRRLKELNPDLRIYGYISTKYWFNGNRWGTDIDPAWLLRSTAGEVIPFTRERYDLDSKELGSYVDVANPDYRRWVVGVAADWMTAAPYDGIRFDAADPIGDSGERDRRKWAELLTPERIDAYNRGIEELFRMASTELAPAQVLFNGISPSPLRGEDRNLGQLDYTDGAMDENFCIDDQGQPHHLIEDIEIMRTYPDRSLQLRAAYDPSAHSDAERARLQRLCLGVFLMGWQPGSTYLNMGMGYGIDQLDDQPADIGLNLGAPTGPYSASGDVLSRGFEHGWVHVNIGEVAASLPVDNAAVRLADGQVHGAVEGSVAVEPGDAAFLVRADLVAEEGPG